MKKKITPYLLLGVISFFLAAAGLFAVAHATPALAQGFGLNEVNNGLNNSLTQTDPRVIVGRIIQIALSFLGAIAIGLIMYAGFLWTTSGGEEEKLERAKAILRDAVIGLVIILSAWGIATFVLAQLMAATGTGGGSNAPSAGGNNGIASAGAAALGSCSVSTVYPDAGASAVPRNTSILATFKIGLDLNGLCVSATGTPCVCDNNSCTKINPAAVQIYKTDLGNACAATCPTPNGNATDVQASVSSDGQTLVLTPSSLLGVPDGDTAYSVLLTNQVKQANGSSMFSGCAGGAMSWNFSVSNTVDLTPPIVAVNGMSPLPDNAADLAQVTTPAAPASGNLTVKACPQTYAPASILNVTPAAPVVLNYHGPLAQFKVAVPAGAINKAQLFDANNNLLGIVDFDASGRAVFPNYLTLTAASHPAGSLWTVNIQPERLSDILTVGTDVYSFATSSDRNNIAVPAVCDTSVQAANIQAKLSGNQDLDISRRSNTIGLQAKVAGAAGDSISITSSDPAAVAVAPLAGGTDLAQHDQVRDKPDRPMNSALQVTFSKPINPLTIAGTAAQVAKYARVVNADASSSPAGTSCTADSQCRSYKCDGGACVGDYLGGTFTVSNAYKTLEFVSDQECGINSCGEQIYCLPPDSHLAMTMNAADLKTCASDNDCLAYSPYSSCQATSLGYKTCQNPAGQNYPTANLAALDGIVDASANSLDGNRSQTADGPLGFYDANNPAATSTVTRDNYRWSFYIGDQIDQTPPQITVVVPVPSQSGLNPNVPIEITFNTLMLNSTLGTGQVTAASGTSTVQHKLINLLSSSPAPLGAAKSRPATCWNPGSTWPCPTRTPPW